MRNDITIIVTYIVKAICSDRKHHCKYFSVITECINRVCPQKELDNYTERKKNTLYFHLGMKMDRIWTDIIDIIFVFIFLIGFGFEYG